MTDQELKDHIAKLDKQIAEAPDGMAKDLLVKMRESLTRSSTINAMGNLSSQLLDPTSKFYQQYASYLQKATPGIGTNTLLAPLMAGGTGYAGGQAIASQKATGFARERQDSVNKGVQGFAMGNINVGANLLGNQGNLQLGYANLAEQQRQYNDQNSGWNQFFGTLGQGCRFIMGGGGSVRWDGRLSEQSSAPVRILHRDIRRLICQKIY